MRVRIIGPGRAGGAFALALGEVGCDVELLDRWAPIAAVAEGVDAALICTPDGAIAKVAGSIEPADAVVLHCSGASGLDVLAGHERVGSVHPLMSLPDPETGAERLRAGGWFAVAGDPIATEIVDRLGGRHFLVDDARRALYHATAAISANHLVALMGQVERLAELAGVPLEAFLDLAAGSFDDVRRVGAAAALTGPAARGDHQTMQAHRQALPPGEVALYDALAEAAARLASEEA